MSTSRRLKVVSEQAPQYAIAVRVSRVGGRSGERFLSPEIQITAATRAIANAGGVLNVDVGDQGVFYDLDVSGAVAPEDRPGLGQALELVRAGTLQGVAIYDLSRFSRDTANGLRALERIAATGGVVLSASETIDMANPAGEFSTTVQLAANQLRRREAAKAWKDTHARRFEMGLPHGKLPLGYVSDRGRAVADPVLGPAVALAFEEYAAGGVSQKTLAERLGALRGRPMRQGVVSQLLRNHFYTGQLELLGETRPGIHAPLVDEQLFLAVQRRLNFEREAGPHWRTPGSPVVGLVFCVVCHGPLYRSGAGSRGGAVRAARLVCSGRSAGECVGIGAPLLKDVELAVRDLALEVSADLTDETPASIERNSRATRARVELDRMRGERDELLNAIGRLGVSHARNVMDEAAYGIGVAELQKDLAAVESRLLVLEVAEVQVARPAEELRSAAERLEQLWGVMTPIEARAMLQVFVPRVELRRAQYRGESMSARLVPPE